MSNNKHSGRGIYGKGYYIALILCAVAIGITGILYYRNAQEAQPVIQEPEQQATVAVDIHQEDLEVAATNPVVVHKPEVEIPVEVPAPQVLKTAAPVSGETVAAYAMDCLSYNQTTRDWRVHNGVDLAAEEGAPVCASCDGTVYTTYQDDSMGYTVVIRHDGGYTTRYSSLTEDLAVSAGDPVQAGQTIGYAADSAIVETTLGSHVHFSVTQYDEPMDPADFLALSE